MPDHSEERRDCRRRRPDQRPWRGIDIARRATGVRRPQAGIPASEVAVLHDDTSRTPTEHGSGLGLWLVHQLVQVFDGRLDVDRSPDSEFTTEVSMRLQPEARSSALERSS